MQVDRRGRERSEIVGQLWASLGAVQTLRVRDVGRGGALVEGAHPLAPQSVHRARLVLEPVGGAVEGRVCRVDPAAPDGRGYVIGVEFVQLPVPLLERIDGLVAAGTEDLLDRFAAREDVGSLAERRRTPRVAALGLGRWEMIIWSTVRLVDISLSGVLLASSRPIEVSERAELRAAFDGDSFNSTVEVRRVQADEPGVEGGATRLGVRFVEIDEGSRRMLERFLRRTIA